MRIAILEDEPSQAALIQSWLVAAGHDCHLFGNGRELIARAAHESFDLFLLDWQVPEISGEAVLRWVREHVTEPVPVMFVTGREAEADIVAALEQGADDYMKKPVTRAELLARVQSLLRRAYPNQRPGTLDIESISFDLRLRTLTLAGAPVDLTQKEFDLALFLVQNIGRLLSRGHIQQSVWGNTVEIPSRTIDTHVSRIRTKLSLRPEGGFKLTPVYNYGYRLERLHAAQP